MLWKFDYRQVYLLRNWRKSWGNSPNAKLLQISTFLSARKDTEGGAFTCPRSEIKIRLSSDPIWMPASLVRKFEIWSSDLSIGIDDAGPPPKSHQRKNGFRRAEITMSFDKGDFSSL